jgi:hypothetical protein
MQPIHGNAPLALALPPSRRRTQLIAITRAEVVPACDLLPLTERISTTYTLPSAGRIVVGFDLSPGLSSSEMRPRWWLAREYTVLVLCNAVNHTVLPYQTAEMGYRMQIRIRIHQLPQSLML